MASRSPLEALAAPVAIGAGALVVLGDLYHPLWDALDWGERSELLTDPLYRAHGLAIAVGLALALFALAGLALRQRFGTLGWIGVVVAFVGTTLVAGDYWAESVVTPGVVAASPLLADADASGGHLATVIVAFALYAVGWLLVGIATWRAKALPRWVAALVMVGAVIGFTPFAGSNLLLGAGILSMGLGARRA